MRYYASRISENMSETPEGFLLCTGVSIARTGEQEYVEGETPLKSKDGKVIVYRDEKEVFSPQTIASFEGKPFTINHPKEFVNSGNWRHLAHGHLQNVRRGKGDQANDLVADIMITDQHAISLVKNGMRELSCGYEAEYVQQDDGRGEQRDIVGNHIALVDEGRAGPSYAINDHKGDSMKSKFLALKATLLGLAKTIDEAAADPKEKEAKDAAEKEAKEKSEKEAADKASADEAASDAAMFDELTKMCADLSAKVAAMKLKDAAAAEGAAGKEEKTGDEPVSPALEERMKKLEDMVAKLLGSEAEAGDADGEEEEETGDEGAEENLVGDTGDTASRAEILSPGIQITKDVKASALKKCYETADGKKVIDSICGGKPKFESPEAVEMMFLAASELLKGQRSDELAVAKVRSTAKDAFTGLAPVGIITADKLNEMNAKTYGRAK